VASCALGRPFAETKPVRYIYVDEAGTSAPEPVSVVVGIIVHPDTQWLAVESEINRLLDEYVPREIRRGFVFHATEVFSGGRYRDRWPRDRRSALLHEMLSIPKRFGLPVAYAMTRRNAFAPSIYESVAPHKLKPASFDHFMAFVMCVGHADRHLRLYTHDSEVATLVLEDVSHMRKLLRAVPSLMRNLPIRTSAEHIHRIGAPSRSDAVEPPEELKVSKIVDCAHYAEKSEAPLLQLADACAFTLRRWVNRESHGEDLIRSLRDETPEVSGFAQPASAGVFLVRRPSLERSSTDPPSKPAEENR
jgi:hypothetical protein